MASRRTLKAAQAIREVVATSLLTDLKDPRVETTTITKVEVSADMRNAKVFFMIRGGEAKERLALKGLQSAAGYLQQKCAKRIDARYTPKLSFEVDEGVKNLLEITRILAEERNAKEAAERGNEAEEEFEEEFEEDEDEADEEDDADDSQANG
ncbi:MAG: 30S ribosome-binding factor RbfA [Thermoguttaceae bacterium]|nr:30S ribosome-binding factor RbfA [Thermoguttaceae bacterium]MBQ8286833.1 30S ribosome-binding factor RbfA [Thermoguttaceae bacterium]